jgi:CRP/FNR family cyclic AMP-dependent transcriptional regulator
MAEQSSFTRVTYKKGTRIIKQGREGGALYLIVDGSAAIVKDYKSDNAKTLAKVGPGAIFGEMSLLDGEPHAASVIALEDTELSTMSQEEFDRLYEEMNPIMQGIVQLLIDRLRQNL